MNRIFDWLDHRTGCRTFVYDALYERVPGGARWRYVWGSTLVFAFVVQTITGFFLWAAYSPNSQGAWESVYYIQNEMAAGWLLRGVHHFMAQAMVVLLALHLLQVVVDGAYRAPREINFWIGLLLLNIVLGLSLTGYLLPWDQKGYWATKVATNILGTTPVVGPALQKLVVGGTQYGHHTLTRFFAIHAGLLPALLIGLVAVHVSLFRRHGVTPYKPDPLRDTTFWPDQIMKDSVACLAVLAVVLFLVLLPALHGGTPGADLGAPADPSDRYDARPEWYFLFLFQLLKAFPGKMEIIGSHVIPGIAMLVLFLMPLVGRWQLGHRFNVTFLVIVLLGVAGLTVAAVDADRKDAEFVAGKEQAERAAERVEELVEAYGIGTAGAVELVRQDPLLQGPSIFARSCAGCHRYGGHNGVGQTPDKPATAADLGNFGSREWVRSVLVDYKNHFADLESATWDGESVGSRFLEEGEMVDWSETHKELLTGEANQESLAAIVEFLVAQSQRSDLSPVDEQLVKTGREIFESGELADGEIGACADCHSMHAVGEEQPIYDEGHAPNLTGYGGTDWLKRFIADPGSEQFYGENNAMPAFQAQLTERELELVSRWLAGDYFRPETAAPTGDSSPADASTEKGD